MAVTGAGWSLALASWNIYWYPELSITHNVLYKKEVHHSCTRNRLLIDTVDWIKHKSCFKTETVSVTDFGRNCRGPEAPLKFMHHRTSAAAIGSFKLAWSTEQHSPVRPSFVLSVLSLSHPHPCAGTSTWSHWTVTQTGELIQGSSNPEQLPHVLGSVREGDGGCPQQLLPATVLILSTCEMWLQHLEQNFAKLKYKVKQR